MSSMYNHKLYIMVIFGFVDLTVTYVISFMYSWFIVLRRFYDKRDAEDALEAMDGRMLDGRELRVQMARYGRPTSPQTRRGGRGDRRDRDRGGRR